jgi:hypothetical protein
MDLYLYEVFISFAVKCTSTYIGIYRHSIVCSRLIDNWKIEMYSFLLNIVQPFILLNLN